MNAQSSRAILTAALLLITIPAFGQGGAARPDTSVELNRPLPLQDFVFCGTVEGARMQAAKFRVQGTLPFDPVGMSANKHFGCFLVIAAATPLRFESATGVYRT